MAISEAERFANDLVGNLTLRNTVTTGASGLASVVDIANKNGYSFTIEEAKQYMQSQSPHQLTDAQLDAVAGGKSSTATNTVQTAETVTTAVTGAEVVTEVVALGAVVLT